ncbi:MAG: 1-acyl-sn-glycerol-3-phosphate acyltransferase [Flavobacteriales bacterium]|nr:1-acyl-sn-glycerol-3-phosphate acyltransferase [Flavobacteriales bacterium]
MHESAHTAPGHQVAEGEALRSPLRKWAFALPRLLFKGWFALAFALSLVVLYLPFRMLLRKPSGYPAAFRLMRGWARFLGIAGMMPLRVEWKGQLPPSPYVVCINHSSYLDIVHAFNVLPEYFVFLGKHELLYWPLFNIFFRDMHIAVNRSNGAEAARALMRAGRALDAGISVGLFPEGTISGHAPRMLPFKDGAFRLAVKKQVPIVPITFVNNWLLFGDPEQPWSRGRPGIARAVVHPAVPTRGLGPADVDNLRQRVFDTIESPLRQAYPRP